MASNLNYKKVSETIMNLLKVIECTKKYQKRKKVQGRTYQKESEKIDPV